MEARTEEPTVEAARNLIAEGRTFRIKSKVGDGTINALHGICRDLGKRYVVLHCELLSFEDFRPWPVGPGGVATATMNSVRAADVVVVDRVEALGRHERDSLLALLASKQAVFVTS